MKQTRESAEMTTEVELVWKNKGSGKLYETINKKVLRPACNYEREEAGQLNPVPLSFIHQLDIALSLN